VITAAGGAFVGLLAHVEVRIKLVSISVLARWDMPLARASRAKVVGSAAACSPDSKADHRSQPW
jgi:hypothetical protein